MMQPNPNDIVRMQNQQHQAYPNAFTIPITGTLQPPQQAQPPPQMPIQYQRRQRNQKKIPANPQQIQPPVQPRNLNPTQTLDQYIASKGPQDNEHARFYHLIFPNRRIQINPLIIQYLNTYQDDPAAINFFLNLPVPLLFERALDHEPAVYFPGTFQVHPNGYEYNLDKTKLINDKLYLACYFISFDLRINRMINLKLTVFGTPDSIDCYQYGESGLNFYYMLNANKYNFPIYIKPIIDKYIFVVQPCRLKNEENIKKTLFSQRPNMPSDLSQASFCCPECRHQNFTFEELIKRVLSRGNIECDHCKKIIPFDKLLILNSNPTDMASILLYVNLQTKIQNDFDSLNINSFIENTENNDGDENNYNLPDFQTSDEYNDLLNSFFHT